MHRDVSKIGGDAPNSRIQTWSAWMRLECNLDFYDDMVRLCRREEFHKQFRNWKILAQTKQREDYQNRQARLRTFPFLEFVYRDGQAGLKNFGFMKPPNSVKSLRRCLELHVQLQEEYIKAVLDKGGVYSVPAQLSISHVAQGVNAAEIGAIIEKSGSQQDCFAFQVLEPTPKGSYHLHGDKDMIYGQTAVPMLIQKYTPWLCDDYPNADLTLSSHLDPGLMDMLDVGTWQVLRTTMRQWQVGVEGLGETLSTIV